MSRRARPAGALVAAALLAWAAPASAQAIHKCTDAQGRVTYQEVPCADGQARKRVDTTNAREAEEREARRELEREAYRGNRLARDFADEARERERQKQLERLEELRREERLRRERASEKRADEEPPEWKTPWGWPGKPGLAKPKPAP